MTFTFRIAEAIIVARKAHEDVNQKYDGQPYFDTHVMQVLKYALRYIHLLPNYCHEDVILAILFHDTIEDCRMTYNDLVKIIGPTAADMVWGVTTDQGRNRDERNSPAYYERMRTHGFAVFVKLCDRLANMSQSIKNDHGMGKKYMKEYPHFKEEIYQKGNLIITYDINLQQMWDELETILNIRPDVEFRIT